MIQAHISSNGFGNNSNGGGFLGSVRRVLTLFAAFVVGALVLIAASVVAVATAIVGLIIAFVAMLLRFGAYRKRPSNMADRTSQTLDEPGDVLEAHRTARGWKVDS